MKTIVGLYDNMHDAEEVITELVQAGFDRSDISLMAADRRTDDVAAATSAATTGATMAAIDTTSTTDALTPADAAAPTSDQMASDVTTGAVTGGVVGGVTGVLLGLGVLAIPGFEDTQCGFKCFRREVAHDILPRQTIDGWAFDVELLFIALRQGYHVIEVPVDWYYGENSRISPVRDTINMIREVLRIRYNGWTGRYDRPAHNSAAVPRVR